MAGFPWTFSTSIGYGGYANIKAELEYLPRAYHTNNGFARNGCLLADGISKRIHDAGTRVVVEL